MKTKHTLGPCSYDFHGVNGPDKYKTRLATFTEEAKRSGQADIYGPLFAAAPELLKACKTALKRITDNFDRSYDIGGVPFDQDVEDVLRTAIFKAKGK